MMYVSPFLPANDIKQMGNIHGLCSAMYHGGEITVKSVLHWYSSYFIYVQDKLRRTPGPDHLAGEAGGHSGQDCVLSAWADRTAVALPRTGGLGHCYSSFGGLKARLLQCTLHYNTWVCPWRRPQKLQLLQNAAAQVLMGANKYKHVTPILRRYIG